MNIIKEVSSERHLWQLDKKPELHSGGFFKELDSDIENQNNLFKETIDIISDGEIKLYCGANYEFAGPLRNLYHDITGEYPNNVYYQEDKHSVSIRITLLMKEKYSTRFQTLMNLNSLPFNCCFIFNGFSMSSPGWKKYSKWITVNTKFGFYLIQMLGARL